MSLKVVQMPLASLSEYAGNAKIHDEANVEAIRASIRRFGMCDPIGVWTAPDGTVEIVEGHGRKMALEAEGYDVADVIFLDHLTDEERRAYALAHNQTTLMSDFDLDILDAELDLLADFDMGDFGFVLGDGSGGFFDSAHRFDGDYSADEGESDEYNEFVAKFEPKRTTDDCYTPDNVYDAVADFVAGEYGIDRSKFVRPFYPGGDYQRERYPEGCVVVDNPPFSILAEIQRWYIGNGVRFFLFAPTLTLFSGVDGACYMPTGVGVTYDNGACVNTSFVTNLDGARVRTAPALYDAVKAANDENEKARPKELPKYSYPDEVITAAMVARWCKYGIEYSLGAEECERVSALDAQKEVGKSIFGNGFLISERAAVERVAAERNASERAAAERAAATKWELSDREREIVARLGNAAKPQTT